MRSSGGVDQQVVHQLAGADQQMGHPGPRQPGLGDGIAAAPADGLLDLRQFTVDVADHRFCGLAW